MTQVTPHYVKPSQLRIGLYIYLDLGWMDHPFPVSSFEIRNQDQINKLCGLGLDQIRYSPEKSTPEPNRIESELSDYQVRPLPQIVVALSATQMREQQLGLQQASFLRCERLFSQSLQDYKRIAENLHSAPEHACELAKAAVHQLLDGILQEDEAAIRLLSEKNGEKSALHAVNVTLISLLLGKALELPKEEMAELGLGAMLHDMGKLDLPERQRWLDEYSSPAERQLYQSHVVHGVSMARKMALSHSATLLIAQHHEFADGSGFPSQVMNEKMTGLSRIISVVNRFDNLCNPGHAGVALTPHEALSQLFTKYKAQSDTRTLTAFIKMMGIYPPGSVVQLSDERYAMVVSVNSAKPMKPRVIIHDHKIAPDDAVIFNLEDDAQIGIRRSLKPLQLPKSAYDFLTPRHRLSYFYEPTSLHA